MSAQRNYKGIYARAKEAGMDEDQRRDVFERLTGKRNLSLMSDGEVARVMAHFKKVTPNRNARKPEAKRADIRFIHVLWKKLGEAGVLNDPTRKGLNTFIRSRFEQTFGAAMIDVDAMTEHRDIAMVIEALKDWCDRVGVELER